MSSDKKTDVEPSETVSKETGLDVGKETKPAPQKGAASDRKSTRLNSSHRL